MGSAKHGPQPPTLLRTKLHFPPWDLLGDSARLVRLLWWVESVNEQNRSLDRVNEAIELALEEAGIDMPNPTYDFNLRMEGESNDRAAQALPDGGRKGVGLRDKSIKHNIQSKGTKNVTRNNFKNDARTDS